MPSTNEALHQSYPFVVLVTVTYTSRVVVQVMDGVTYVLLDGIHLGERALGEVVSPGQN